MVDRVVGLYIVGRTVVAADKNQNNTNRGPMIDQPICHATDDFDEGHAYQWGSNDDTAKKSYSKYNLHIDWVLVDIQNTA